jgi:hypothetical protein
MEMTLPDAVTSALVGNPHPRLAPPVPAVTDLEGFREVAHALQIEPYPWQETSIRYAEARAADGRYLYQEFAEVVARQNGKTKKLVPLIVKRLRAGRRIMHTAQNRELPREVFGEVADAMEAHFPSLLKRRPRFANGQEEILLKNGGRYKIVAPTRGGARGGTNDDVIIDEAREFETFDFIGAAKPTLTASPDPQIIYLSNAGEVDSVLLNSLRDRAGKDPRLAYLEWSAPPDLDAGDKSGWVQANPSIGHIPTMLEYLEGEYLSNKLAGTLAIFETEHLCRWVVSMRERLVGESEWLACQEPTGAPKRPFMGIALDPSGTRASAAIAWRIDDTIALRLLFDVPGDPIDTDRLGKDLKTKARELGVLRVGFDPLTDVQLAKHFGRTEPINGQKFANASARFVAVVEGHQLRWEDCAAVGSDLTWTARKAHDESGSFQAVRGDDTRPITAALAAIRAVWLASAPKPTSTSTTPTAMGF